MGSVVGLVRTQSSEEQIRDAISKALELIDFNAKNSVNSVAVKVNLCYYWHAATGYTTDPRVVAGVIDMLREIYGKDIGIKVVEADATAMKTNHVFLMLGYEKLANEKKIELFNLSHDNLDEKRVNVNGREIMFKIPKSLLEADLFVNVPKLKLMGATIITCALKNIFGCMGSPRKIVYHPFLNEAIVGINKILHPHLTIVDGLTALGRSPVRLGLIMASCDPFSIDWVASKIMGYDPSRIDYLKLARKEGIGSPNGIKILGEDLEKLRKMFPHANAFGLKWSNKILLRLLKFYSAIVGDTVPPELEENINASH